MSDYFLNLARIAIGKGERIEPRIQTAFEDEGWMEIEAEDAGDAGTETQETVAVDNVSNDSIVEFHLHPVHETHDHSATEFSHETEKSIQDSTSRESDREIERHTERTDRERLETKETLRELFREAQIQRTDRWSQHERIVERAIPIPNHTIERLLETERLIRESQASSSQTFIQTPASQLTVPGIEPPREPDIEIHIGRIEIRAENSGQPKESEKKDKPNGVISLEEYLRRRNREVL